MSDEKEIAYKWFRKGVLAICIETNTDIELEDLNKAFEIRWKDRETEGEKK